MSNYAAEIPPVAPYCVRWTSLTPGTCPVSVNQALGQELSRPPLFYEAIPTLGKKTLLFCGFGSCGNDTLSISLVQILLNFVVGESTDASENPERVQRMSQIFPTSHFQKRWESLVGDFGEERGITLFSEFR